MKLTDRFDLLQMNDSGYCLDVSLKEIFEKWEWFAEIYLTTIEWSGTTIGVRDMTYHIRKDQKRIFYALQQAKSNQLNHEEFWLVQSYRVYQGKEIFNKRLKEINDELIANMLECINRVDIGSD